VALKVMSPYRSSDRVTRAGEGTVEGGSMGAASSSATAQPSAASRLAYRLSCIRAT
jgi:hypothetical protein